MNKNTTDTEKKIPFTRSYPTIAPIRTDTAEFRSANSKTAHDNRTETIHICLFANGMAPPSIVASNDSEYDATGNAIGNRCSAPEPPPSSSSSAIVGVANVASSDNVDLVDNVEQLLAGDDDVGTVDGGDDKEELVPEWGLPKKQGLYDPDNEHDACGVGFIVAIDGKRSHKVSVFWRWSCCDIFAVFVI